MPRTAVKHSTTLEERLLSSARASRETAGQLPEGAERDAAIRKADQAEAAAALCADLMSTA